MADKWKMEDAVRCIQEIARTLLSIEARLARLERAAAPDPWGEPDHHTSGLVIRPGVTPGVPVVGSGRGAPPAPKP